MCFRKKTIKHVHELMVNGPVSQFVHLHIAPEVFNALDAVCDHSKRLLEKQRAGYEITTSDVKTDRNFIKGKERLLL